MVSQYHWSYHYSMIISLIFFSICFPCNLSLCYLFPLEICSICSLTFSLTLVSLFTELIHFNLPFSLSSNFAFFTLLISNPAIQFALNIFNPILPPQWSLHSFHPLFVVPNISSFFKELRPVGVSLQEISKEILRFFIIATGEWGIRQNIIWLI